MLIVIILSVIMLSVVVLRVVILSVVMLSVVILSVVMLNVMAPALHLPLKNVWKAKIGLFQLSICDINSERRISVANKMKRNETKLK
jgi:hypothetical protein